MKNRPWNVERTTEAFWDPGLNINSCVIRLQTLKQVLQNPEGQKFEDVVKMVAEGLAMVMDAIDADDVKNSNDNPLEHEKTTIVFKYKVLPMTSLNLDFKVQFNSPMAEIKLLTIPPRTHSVSFMDVEQAIRKEYNLPNTQEVELIKVENF